ncbi:MAG: hypothetical protein ACREPE_04315 [Lysobacter sp.]
MSDPNPATTTTARKGNASKYLFLFVLGLVIGIVATVMAVRAINARKDHFHDSVMHVQQWHFDQLKSKVQQNSCGATDTLPHLRALRTMADDVEPAFPDLSDDQRFNTHASKLRGSLDAALASPPLSCEGVTKLVSDIGEACKACHQDFRN